MSRTAVAILSTENLRHNVGVIRQMTNDSKIVAMVKANGYGHGIRSVSQRLEGFVDLLGVASIDEALALRKASVRTPILLIEGVFEASEYLVASTADFHVVVHNPLQLEWLLRSDLPRPISIWIKIDTGLGRLGFSLKDASDAFDKIYESKNTQKPICIMSHFACADNKNHPLNEIQIKAFHDFINTHTKEKKCVYSFCNSAGLISFGDKAFDYVRPGLALYGISPIHNVSANDLNLKPVMTLQSSLISINMRQKGSFIGYGARYQCQRDMQVGIIAFGYGDGYPITAKDGTPVLIKGIRCPLVGRVSMDMLAVDLTPLLKVSENNHLMAPRIGDTVVLWGESLPVEEIAGFTNNITYDLLTGIQNRVKFLWL